MAIPVINTVTPNNGSSGDNELVKIAGSGFSENLSVLFDSKPAEVIVVREEGGESIADVKTPGHEPSLVTVTVINLDSEGEPIPGEQAVLSDAYRFKRSELIQETDLTRLIRTIIRNIKQQLIENTSITVSVDYDDTSLDGLDVVAISKLPSLVLSGPSVEENRFFSTNEPRDFMVESVLGPEVIRHDPPFTVDLNFTITVASDRTVELLNLMAAVATFLSRNRWLEMERDPSSPDLGTVKWEMAPVGEFRTRLDEGNDIRVFTCGFVIRGFDIDEGAPSQIGRLVDSTELSASAIQNGGTP